MNTSDSQPGTTWFQQRFKAPHEHNFRDGSAGQFSVGFRTMFKPPLLGALPMEGITIFGACYFVAVMVKPLFLVAMLAGTLLACWSNRQLRHLPAVQLRGGLGFWLEVDQARVAAIVRRALTKGKRIEVIFDNRDPKRRRNLAHMAVALGKHLESLGAQCVLVPGDHMGVNLEGLAHRYEDIDQARDEAESALAKGEIDAIIYSHEPASGLLAYFLEYYGWFPIYSSAEEVEFMGEHQSGRLLQARVLDQDAQVETPCVVKTQDAGLVFSLLASGHRGIRFFICRDELMPVPDSARVRRIRIANGRTQSTSRPQLIFSRIE